MNYFLLTMLVILIVAWGAREIMVEREIQQWREIARQATACTREAVDNLERCKGHKRQIRLVVDNAERIH